MKIETNQFFSSEGIIELSPPDNKPGWTIVSVCPELARYYSYFLRRKLAPPARGPHITFTAGEKESVSFDFSRLDRYKGVKIQFKYNNLIWTNGQAFWLDCWSNDLDEIREELGLLPRRLHLTIGNIKNEIKR